MVEATSGNTGIAVAMVCAQRGYNFVATMAASFSMERRKVMRALGAKVIVTPAPLGGTGMVKKAGELAESMGSTSPASSRKRKAAKVVRVAVGAALAALHRDAVPVDGVGALAASTARCLVGHCGETKAVLQILGDASSQAQRAADALAKTELMLSCEAGDVEQCKRALAKGADPDSRARDCDGNFGPTGAPAAPEDDDLDPEAKAAAEASEQGGGLRIIMLGNLVTITLNDKLVVDVHMINQT